MVKVIQLEVFETGGVLPLNEEPVAVASVRDTDDTDGLIAVATVDGLVTWYACLARRAPARAAHPPHRPLAPAALFLHSASAQPRGGSSRATAGTAARPRRAVPCRALVPHTVPRATRTPGSTARPFMVRRRGPRAPVVDRARAMPKIIQLQRRFRGHLLLPVSREHPEPLLWRGAGRAHRARGNARRPRPRSPRSFDSKDSGCRMVPRSAWLGSSVRRTVFGLFLMGGGGCGGCALPPRARAPPVVRAHSRVRLGVRAPYSLRTRPPRALAAAPLRRGHRGG